MSCQLPSPNRKLSSYLFQMPARIVLLFVAFVAFAVLALPSTTHAQNADNGSEAIAVFDSSGAGGAWDSGLENLLSAAPDGSGFIAWEDWLSSLPLLSSSTPSSYDLRDVDGRCYVTPARMQSFNTCWAYSFCCAAESNYLLQAGGAADLEAAEDMISLSPVQLSYFTYQTPASVRKGLEGDSIEQTDGFKGFNEGGRYSYACFTSMQWTGLVDVEDAPDSILSDSSDASFAAHASELPDTLAFGSNSYQVVGFTFVDSADRDAVKEAIMEYGAAEASYYHDDAFLNKSNAAYYQNAFSSSNHGVAIIGWDDNYSVDNFSESCRPSSAGAWLCKNSWGDEWGDNGFFWISYEDLSTQSAPFAFVEVESASDCGDIYQYDGNFSITGVYAAGSTDYLGGANVFTADGNTDISSISFMNLIPDTAYAVQIYRCPSDDDPESGTPLLSSPIVGTVDSVEYRNIDLGTVLSFEDGETFSVVVTLTRDDGQYPKLGTDKTEVQLGGAHTTSIGAALEGQSYFKGENTSWTDLGKQYNANLRIKAYGTETSVVDIATADVADVASSTYTGGEIKPSVNISYDGTPLVEGNDYTLSYADNINAGTATISIHGIGSFAGEKKITFDIVPKSIADLEVNGIEDKTYTGEPITQSISMAYNGHALVDGTDYIVTYGDNKEIGTASIDISGIGNYSGTKTQQFKITASDPTPSPSPTITPASSNTSTQAAASGSSSSSGQISQTSDAMFFIIPLTAALSVIALIAVAIRRFRR